MPQNISVVIIDSDIESINNIVKYGDRKLSLRVKLRGEAEANSEIRRFAPQSRLCNEIATVETTSQ